MEKEFLSYDLALELKELGFEEPCFGFYRKEKLYLCDYKNVNEEKISIISAPFYQQVFRFFREKYGLHYIICKNIQMDGYGYREVILIPYMEENENTIFKTYEEAELACIRKLIEIAKEQNVK